MLATFRIFERNKLYPNFQRSYLSNFRSATSFDTIFSSRNLHNSPFLKEIEALRKMTKKVGRDVLSVAPMMEWTDRHYRYLMRLLTRHTKLYTEMVVENTLKHSPVAQGYLRFHPVEHPIALQVGGSCPQGLADAARMAEAAGYDEINLNCGCPSPRVAGKGCFGAALMFSPGLVRDCVRAMREAAPNTEITVKCRLGADHMDSYEEFRNFVAIVSESGCKHFIVHARKAFLKGLDPKANRTIPPLRYYWVQRIAIEFPHLRFSLNGGIIFLEQIEQLLSLTREGEPLEFPSAPPLSNEEKEFIEQRKKERKEQRQKKDDSTTADSPSENEKLAEIVEGLQKLSCVSDGEPVSISSPVTDIETIERDENDPGVIKFRAIMAKKAVHDAIVGRVPESQFYEGVRQGKVAPGTYGDYTTHIFDSLMIGRAAYNNMWIFADADRRLFGAPNPGFSRREIIHKYLEYCETVIDTLPEDEKKMSLYKPFELVKPLIGLFHGERGSGKFRAVLTQGVLEKKMSIRDSIFAAMEELASEVLDEKPPMCDSQTEN